MYSHTASTDRFRKNTAVAYLLWLFFGFAGVHRAYLGRTDSGMAQLLLFVIGFATSLFAIGPFVFMSLALWWLCDAWLIRGMVRDAGLQPAASRRSKPTAVFKA